MTDENVRARARRLETLNLVSFTHKDPDGRVDLESVGRTLDLSEGGILLEISRPIPAGNTEVEVTLGIRDRVISTLGEIIHQRELENGYVGIGIAFKDLAQEDSRAIKNFLGDDGEE